MNQSMLGLLDLSNNQISGVIPNWIWNIGDGSPCAYANQLNLSGNLLVGLQRGYVIPPLHVLDLHSNQLYSELPIPQDSTGYVDYSRNNFSSSMPAEIGNRISTAYFFSFSRNMLSGPIPPSICNGSKLQVFDLSNNRFTSTIPQCLIYKCTATLGILNLRNNNLTGNIMGTFLEDCALRTLDLSENLLEGYVPKSLANCANAEVLNLGTNNMNGNFRCFLANLSELHVLVLRSNKFHGNIRCQEIHNYIWPKLQTIDLALNNLNGILPPKFFSQRKAMMDGGNATPHLNHLRFESSYELESLDLSWNKLGGSIPVTPCKSNISFIPELIIQSTRWNDPKRPPTSNISRNFIQRKQRIMRSFFDRLLQESRTGTTDIGWYAIIY
ncbi:hypothetical protein RHMOL_Rhmol05G0307500 [Rhododendron molle]|uniref:Uncharacterized protein n=1 Tax=Rhododendron molle TaxID=49168 RepID=A0ACC0NUM4_RHOML|nr:hypothetical protein RHMOL_Rhmol05G0307500 [Rhododendron molle]